MRRQTSRLIQIESPSMAYISLALLILGTFFTLRFQVWQKYVFLANQWYNIRDISIKYPQFHDVTKTQDYKNAFAASTQIATHYGSYARLRWGFAEDVYFHASALNRLFGYDLMAEYLADIREVKRLHMPWLEDNAELFATKDFMAFVKNDI